MKTITLTALTALTFIGCGSTSSTSVTPVSSTPSCESTKYIVAETNLIVVLDMTNGHNYRHLNSTANLIKVSNGAYTYEVSQNLLVDSPIEQDILIGVIGKVICTDGAVIKNAMFRYSTDKQVLYTKKDR